MATIETVYQSFMALLASGAVNTAVGGRVYKSIGLSAGALPQIVATIIGNPTTDRFGTTTVDIQIDIKVYGYQKLGDTAVSTINDAVYTLINHQTLVASGWTCTPIQNVERGVFSIESGAIKCLSKWTFKGVSA